MRMMHGEKSVTAVDGLYRSVKRNLERFPFIIADQKEIYWSGASLKDAGRLTFARPCGLPSKARCFFGGYLKAEFKGG